jgi:hypothetical protein
MLISHTSKKKKEKKLTYLIPSCPLLDAKKL